MFTFATIHKTRPKGRVVDGAWVVGVASAVAVCRFAVNASPVERQNGTNLNCAARSVRGIRCSGEVGNVREAVGDLTLRGHTFWQPVRQGRRRRAAAVGQPDADHPVVLPAACSGLVVAEVTVPTLEAANALPVDRRRCAGFELSGFGLLPFPFGRARGNYPLVACEELPPRVHCR